MEDHKKMELLKKNVPLAAYGPNMSMYSIALEAWRRGLYVTFFTKKFKSSRHLRYKISDGTKTYILSQSLNYTLTPKESRRTAGKKNLTKELFIKNNVPTPNGKMFTKSSPIEEMLDYAKTLTFPLIIKPASSSLGKGVTIDINSIEELKVAIVESDHHKNNLIIEEQATGSDVRVFVIGDRVVSAFKRVPSHVIGDGTKNIKQLIHEKNKLRRKNPHAYGHQTKINDRIRKHLESKGLNLDTVPKKNNIITLTDSTLQAYGSETVDLTDKLSDESKQVAIDATKCLENIHVCGVDIMVDNDKKTNYVLELNVRPYISGAMFPLTGLGRDLPGAIIDLYFPETKVSNRSPNSYYLYYDFKLIKNSLTSGKIARFTLPSVKTNALTYEKYSLKANAFKDRFSTWLKDRAVALRLNGYIRMIDKTAAELVVLGDQKDHDALLKKIQNHNNNDHKITIDKSDNQPTEAIMAGFFIKKAATNQINKNIKKQKIKIQFLTKEIKSLKKENKILIQGKNQSSITKFKKRIKKALNKPKQ